MNFEMIDIDRLALVLHKANCEPPPHARDDFYRLKEAICDKYGKRDGYDVQEIKDPCWGRSSYYGCGDDCEKCGGSGVYRHVFVRLKRWKLGRFVFHKPDGTLLFSPEHPASIQGRIKHKRQPLAMACWRALTMLLTPGLHVYLDQFRQDEKTLKRMKRVIAYLCGFDPRKWRVEQIKFHEVSRIRDMVPF